MQAIKQRPFAFSCILFLLFSFIFFLAGTKTKVIALILCLITVFVLLLSKHKKLFMLVYVIPPIIISCVISIFFYSVNYQNILTYDGKECDADFVILDCNTVSDGYSSYIVQIQKINGKRAAFNANLMIDKKYDVKSFSSHSAKVKFNAYDDSQNGYSSRYSFLSKSIYLKASVLNDITDNHRIVKKFPSYFFRKINDFFSSILNEYIDGDANALCQALILGNRNKLSPKHTYNFRLLGLSHMLAVSGMHLSILVGSIDKFLEKINIGKNKKHLIMIVITLCYAGITGFSPSVRRAAIMLIIFYISFLVSKNHDSVTALCSSVALIYLISPNSMFDIGLWLSFLSTYGILAVAVPVNEKLKEKINFTSSVFLRLLLKVWALLLYGIVPIMFSIPVIYLSYGEVALLSPLTNILFTPFLLAIMYTCPFVLIFSYLPIFSKLFALVSHASANIMLSIAERIAPKAPIVSINYRFTVFIIIFVVLAYLIFSLMNLKRKILYFIPFVTAILLFAIGVNTYNAKNADDKKIIYSNTFIGDSFLVISNNKGLLCDISGISFQNAKLSEYYLNANHITDLESYVITDYNGAGTNTLDSLLSYTRIDNLYIPYAETEEEKLLENKFINYSQENKLNCIMYDINTDSQIDFYGVDIDIKNVARNMINAPSSICVTFSNGDNSFSYIGLGAYSTASGKGYITNLFNSQKTFLFGSYGKESIVPITSLLYKNDIKLFFPNEDIYRIYFNTIPSSADIKFTKNPLAINLN